MKLIPCLRVFRAGLLLMLGLVVAMPAFGIPAFARKYGLECPSCHESWPVLNNYGRSFRDNGYQLRLGKDDPITASPGYWPVSVRITPTYAYTTVSNQTTDQGLKKLKTGNGVADAGMDLLMAGALTEDISFLVVPSGFASDGKVALEAYWANFSRVIKNSDWLNIRLGKHELDLPASGHRRMSLSTDYLLYGYHPGPAGVQDPAAAAFSMAENQRGVEITGHDRASLLRYNISAFSANDSEGSSHGVSSPSVYAHLQKYVPLDSSGLSQVEFGLWGAHANYPTTFLTLGGVAIAGTGGNLKSTSRYGFEAQAWLGKSVAPLHLNLVYGHGSDNQGLYLGAADRNGTWNGGFLEAIWVPAKERLPWGIFARYDRIRNQSQPVTGSPSNLNDQDQFTVGVRYTIRYTHRDEVAFHVETSTRRQKGFADDGSDVRTNAILFGVDFAY